MTIQRDYEAVSLKHRPWNINASTPNAIANYLCWAQFSPRFWHVWWVSSPFQWLPTITKPVLSISLIGGRLYIRISLTTRENTLVARDGEGFMEVAMLLHVLMLFGDCLRGRRAARIGQRKITQCAHRELWERPVLPGAALRRNCHYWSNVRGIHRSLVDPSHKDQVMTRFIYPRLIPFARLILFTKTIGAFYGMCQKTTP